MKATKTSRQAADFVDVRKNGEGGATYTCLKCGLSTESNVYYETHYKKMLDHAASCDGQGIPPGPKVGQMQSKDVQLYGGGQALSQMVWRVKNCIPNGNRLKDHEAMSLAQIALATGLNPFTGELWYIPGKGPMAGIRGLRRRAKEQSTYSTDFRAMKPDELDEHNVNANDVGRICELYRHDILQRAVEINKAAGSAVVPVKPIVGIGIWRKGDQVPAGKSSTWVAEKRAEADALRRGFDLTELPYADEINGAQFDVADAEDAGWSVLPPDDNEEEEILRRQAATNATRHSDPADLVAKYATTKPAWVTELLDQIHQDPQASDPVGDGFVRNFKVSVERRGIPWPRAQAFVEGLFEHRIEECTKAEARVLMDLANANDSLAEKIAEVLG